VIAKNKNIDFIAVMLHEFLVFNIKSHKPNNPALSHISVHSLCYTVRSRLGLLRRKNGWNNHEEVVINLNLPLHEDVLCSPMEHKYVYEYINKYDSNQYVESHNIYDSEVLTPLVEQDTFIELFDL
jgi:hypothetical protein